MHPSGHCQRIIRKLFQLLTLSCFLSFISIFFKRARKLSTTPWKAQDIPAPIHIEWIATSPFPFPWERICESTFKSFTPVATVGAAGK